MADWSTILDFIMALIGVSGALGWYQARTQRINTVEESAKAAKDTATREWESLTASQRTALEEYRCRLTEVTARVRELETQLAAARETIQALEDRSQAQELKIFRLQQEREEWVREREMLRTRIAELEGCK